MDCREREQGFMLVALLVAVFVMLLVLGVAAPKVARELRREQEVETVHRGNQYVRAIQLYYRKFGHYPGSMEQLENTNTIRFLRKQYVDPMTGKVDWRLIKVGEAKTTVKGFFGKPLTGLTPGLGSAAGMASSGGIGAGAAGTSGASGTSGSAFGGSSSGSTFGGSSSGSAFGGSSSTTSGVGSTAGGSSGSGSSSGSSGFGSSGGSGSGSADGLSGATGPFMGVGLMKTGDSIIVLNEQTTYPTWEFIYDPRIEQMTAQGGLMGGASTSSGGSGFGSSSGSGFGSSSGTGSSSAFGSSSGTGSAFGGSSSGGGFGSSPTTPTSSGSGSGGTTSTSPQ